MISAGPVEQIDDSVSSVVVDDLNPNNKSRKPIDESMDDQLVPNQSYEAITQ
jgi:hypothetical protein